MKEYIDILVNYGPIGIFLAIIALVYKFDIISYLVSSDLDKLFWNASKKSISNSLHNVISFFLICILVYFTGTLLPDLPNWSIVINLVIFVCSLLPIVYIGMSNKYKRLRNVIYHNIIDKAEIIFAISLFTFLVPTSYYIYHFDITAYNEFLKYNLSIFVFISTLVLSFIMLELVKGYKAIIKNKVIYNINIDGEVFEIKESLSNGLIALKSKSDNSIKLINQDEIAIYRLYIE